MTQRRIILWLIKSKPILSSVTGRSTAGTDIASDTAESPVTHAEEEGDTGAEVTSATVEESVRETKYVQESEYEGENKAYEVTEKVIKKRKSYDIAFKIGVVILYKKMNQY